MPDDRYRLRWGHLQSPLTKIYDLSFVRMSVFDTIWVLAEDDSGRLGLGEAVPLTGYNWETLDSIRGAVESIADDRWMRRSEIEARCKAAARRNPFAASAVMSALDMPSALERLDTRPACPLSAPVSGDWSPEQLEQAVKTALASGYGYIKCKVGRDAALDLRAARILLEGNFEKPFKVVFDANQAYDLTTALVVARGFGALKPERFQWFEQAVDRQDWAAMETLCAESPVRIVLDEAIYDAADIARAASMGAFGVKLKLMKNFGIEGTIELSKHASALGMTVVMGNGVATDIGNLAEYLVVANGGVRFADPGECNGFLKLPAQILGGLLSIDKHGAMCCRESVVTIQAALARFAGQVAATTHSVTGISR